MLDVPSSQLPRSTLTRNLKRGHAPIDTPAVAGDAAFVWQREFPEIMKAGGFDVVIDNPPCGVLFEPHHSDYLVEKFRVFRDGVRDIYACFMERSFTLARKAGQIGFILPLAWLSRPNYNPLRKELLKWRIEAVLDLSFHVFPDAYVDTVAVLCRREACTEEPRGLARAVQRETLAQCTQPEPL
jgi:hypothetical protein